MSLPRRWIGATVVAAALLLGARPAAARSAGDVLASLLLEVQADEGTIRVAESFTMAGGGASGQWTVPLLLPESGPRPVVVQKVGDGPGILVRGRGGASATVQDGAVVLSGSPGPSGEFGAEVQYTIPVEDARLVLSAVPAVDLARVEVVHRGGAHALQVRPLAPFAYREEAEEDGTWRYQDLLAPVPAGRTIEVAVGRLPTSAGPYRSAGLALLLAVAAGTVLVLFRRRAG